MFAGAQPEILTTKEKSSISKIYCDLLCVTYPQPFRVQEHEANMPSRLTAKYFAHILLI